MQPVDAIDDSSGVGAENHGQESGGEEIPLLRSRTIGIHSTGEQLQLAQQALQIAPDYPETYLLLAQLAETPEEALEWY